MKLIQFSYVQHLISVCHVQALIFTSLVITALTVTLIIRAYK
jgi:hypothetical protein